MLNNFITEWLATSFCFVVDFHRCVGSAELSWGASPLVRKVQVSSTSLIQSTQGVLQWIGKGQETKPSHANKFKASAH